LPQYCEVIREHPPQKLFTKTVDNFGDNYRATITNRMPLRL
jgi:hypothetical protein